MIPPQLVPVAGHLLLATAAHALPHLAHYSIAHLQALSAGVAQLNAGHSFVAAQSAAHKTLASAGAAAHLNPADLAFAALLGLAAKDKGFRKQLSASLSDISREKGQEDIADGLYKGFLGGS
jgi:hypothetical protein